jgi:murein DD-endopeptidase MepM/ murein hydrolase activator NlpD
MNRQAGMLDKLKEAEARAEKLERMVYEQREAAAVQKARSAKVVVRRVALEKKAAAERRQVSALVSKRGAAKASASRALASDRRILAKLKREEDKIKRMLRARANRGRNHRGSSDGYLTRPVPGAVTSPYGYRTHPIYGYYGLHDGVDFRVGCGERMKAVASGTVVSRYWSDVYGHRLVLDLGRVNGKSLAVIYNHASGYNYGTGANVRRGATIGYGGSTGWSTGCHLHFSVLVNGNTVDPMPWF